MVSKEISHDNDVEYIHVDASPFCASTDYSLDLDTSCNKFFTHSCVKGPCISSKICLIKFWMICLLIVVTMIKMLLFPLVIVWLTM